MLPRERLGKAVCGHLGNGNPLNVNAIRLKFLTEPMVEYINVLELRLQRGLFPLRNRDSLFIIAKYGRISGGFKI